MLTSATDGSCSPLSFDLDKVSGKKRRSIHTTALMKRPKLMDFVKASKKSNGVLR